MRAAIIRGFRESTTVIVYNVNQTNLLQVVLIPKGKDSCHSDIQRKYLFMAHFSSRQNIVAHQETQSPQYNRQSKTNIYETTSNDVVDPAHLAFTWDLFDGQQPISLSNAMTHAEPRRSQVQDRGRTNRKESTTTTELSSPGKAKVVEQEEDLAHHDISTSFNPSDDEIRWEDLA